MHTVTLYNVNKDERVNLLNTDKDRHCRRDGEYASLAQRAHSFMNKTIQTHTIYAPVSGTTIALSNVPDPVFAERLTGDGLAILSDSDEVLAPCDGRITLFFDTKHAFALTTPDGIQILVHIGLDTIIMNGEGITALHHPGEEVTAGTPILQLDLPLLHKKKIDLISPVLIVNYDQVRNMKIQPAGKQVQAGKDIILQFEL